LAKMLVIAWKIKQFTPATECHQNSVMIKYGHTVNTPLFVSKCKWQLPTAANQSQENRPKLLMKQNILQLNQNVVFSCFLTNHKILWQSHGSAKIHLQGLSVAN